MPIIFSQVFFVSPLTHQTLGVCFQFQSHFRYIVSYLPPRLTPTQLDSARKRGVRAIFPPSLSFVNFTVSHVAVKNVATGQNCPLYGFRITSAPTDWKMNGGVYQRCAVIRDLGRHSMLRFATDQNDSGDKNNASDNEGSCYDTRSIVVGWKNVLITAVNNFGVDKKRSTRGGRTNVALKIVYKLSYGLHKLTPPTAVACVGSVWNNYPFLLRFNKMLKPTMFINII